MLGVGRVLGFSTARHLILFHFYCTVLIIGSVSAKMT